MEKDLKALRENLLLPPDYPEVNDSLANFSTDFGPGSPGSIWPEKQKMHGTKTGLFTVG